jgi:hypothetical protein
MPMSDGTRKKETMHKSKNTSKKNPTCHEARTWYAPVN